MALIDTLWGGLAVGINGRARDEKKRNRLRGQESGGFRERSRLMIV